MYLFNRRKHFREAGKAVGSLLCESGGSAYIDWSDHADWDFGAGDFCVEFWARFESSFPQANNALVCHGGRGNDITDYNGWNIKYNTSNGLYWGLRINNTNYDKTFAWTASVDTWYHILLSRDGTDLRAFIDGTQIGSTETCSVDINDGAYPLRIGTAQDLTQDFIGNIDELRISDVYRQNSNFTAPSTPYSVDGNTLFLCHFNGDDESTTFTDETGTHGDALVYGTAEVDTDIYEF